MIFGNWYYDYGRHTRSDRKYSEGTIDCTWAGFKLKNPETGKHLEIKMSDEEIDSFIVELQKIQSAKNKQKKWKSIKQKASIRTLW
jgi:hypothetical protein